VIVVTDRHLSDHKPRCGGAVDQPSGPPRKRVEPFKGSARVQVADQSRRSLCFRELEHSRFELEVLGPPARASAPIHASLCAVVLRHSSRLLPKTSRSSETHRSALHAQRALRQRSLLRLVAYGLTVEYLTKPRELPAQWIELPSGASEH
jgi:hypothetical protein